MSKPGDASRIEVLGEGKFLRLVRRGQWEFVERINSRGVVGIIAITDEGRLVLVEQWREALGKRCVELPAGLVGDENAAEDAAASAARELEEETGYRAESMTWLTDGVSSAGLTGEMLSLFQARGLKRVSAGGGSGNEEIEVHEVPLAEVPAFVQGRIAQGRAIDLKVWAALWLGAERGD